MTAPLTAPDPSAALPDVELPVYMTRALHLVQEFSLEALNAGAQESFPIAEARLIQIIYGVLYVTTDDIVFGQRVIARRGQWLSRNLWLTEQFELDPEIQAEEVFLVLDSAIEVVNAVMAIKDRYEHAALPRLKVFEQTAARMVVLSFAAFRGSHQTASLTDVGFRFAEEFGVTLTPELQEALALVMKAADPIDVDGRFNPRRTGLLMFKVRDLLKAVAESYEGIGGAMETRSRAALSINDQCLAICQEAILEAESTLATKWLEDGTGEPQQRDAMGRSLMRLSTRLALVSPYRPFWHAAAHSSEDFGKAAAALAEGRLQEVLSRMMSIRCAMTLMLEVLPLLMEMRLKLSHYGRIEMTPLETAAVVQWFEGEAGHVFGILSREDFDMWFDGQPASSNVRDRLGRALAMAAAGDFKQASHWLRESIEGI